MEEDGSSEATSDRISQQGTIASVEEEMEDASDTIPTSDGENLMALVQDCIGECSNVCSISGTVDVEEVFGGDLAGPKSKVSEMLCDS